MKRLHNKWRRQTQTADYDDEQHRWWWRRRRRRSLRVKQASKQTKERKKEPHMPFVVMFVEEQRKWGGTETQRKRNKVKNEWLERSGSLDLIWAVSELAVHLNEEWCGIYVCVSLCPDRVWVWITKIQTNRRKDQTNANEEPLPIFM